tara:strand:+ start:51 stop:233 length:183 start_codon:yes stop_codon:yes gene_type:complete
MNELEDTNTQLEKISKILEECDNYDLTPEVVYFALKEMKIDPNMSPLLAIQIAAKDWDVE